MLEPYAFGTIENSRALKIGENTCSLALEVIPVLYITFSMATISAHPCLSRVRAQRASNPIDDTGSSLKYDLKTAPSVDQ